MTDKDARQRAQETTDPDERAFLVRGIAEREERNLRDPAEDFHSKGNR